VYSSSPHFFDADRQGGANFTFAAAQIREDLGKVQIGEERNCS
jgi:hypothetical protein